MRRLFQQRGKELGRSCEELACRFLKNQGYTIIETNFQTRLGEIDIVAQKDNYLVFIEVKARRSYNYGLPQEAVTTRKQQAIKKVAQTFIQKKGLEQKMLRFDVIAITFPKQAKPMIEHIPFAF